ncbi:MAG TPA: prolyl oligopeptidase family serine peptidase [Pirellulales bacterium]|nr:prolyl oligopeptidase family serine peptidase [Pirellulales bacterium]
MQNLPLASGARTRVSAGLFYSLLITAIAPFSAQSAEPAKADPRAVVPLLADYFRRETAQLSAACLADIRSLDDWTVRRDRHRRQLYEMLGLDPLPARTPLRPVVTGTLDHPQFTVEKLHFQSRPGLYVTANLYIPKGLTQPAPAILYVCGHSGIKKDGVSYGNKAKYQRHPIWLARHGFVTLIVDTLELGEIEGEHHGTYSKGMWWWNARGYTPAGVEAWNGIRAIDYLQSRKEVDPERIGVTGRSGGGATSWWLAALDERVQAAVPVAGITDLQNHVVDGCVEGHCDCMYMVNTYRWDYAQVAALAAPRPLLFSNTDSDGIFPLDGVERIHNLLRPIYKLHDADKSLGLQISPGPHLDLQELQVAALHWCNRFLKHGEPLIDDAAVPLFEPEQLAVFEKGKLPPDQKNTTIHETFVPLAPPPKVPQSASEWQEQKKHWRAALEKKVFAGWPRDPGSLNMRLVSHGQNRGLELAIYEFTSQPEVTLRLHVLRPVGAGQAEECTLGVCDQVEWHKWLSIASGRFADQLKDESPPEPIAVGFGSISSGSRQLAFVGPRGVGRSGWNASPAKQTQIRRRYMLLGQTLESMQVWDVRRAMQALRSLPDMDRLSLSIAGEGESAGLVLYASLFEPPVTEIQLSALPKSHREGPNFLNILRYLDTPQAVGMAAERSPVILRNLTDAWEYPLAVAKSLGWKPEQLEVLRSVESTGAQDKK